ncbi:N-acetyltransferase [Lutibacter sp. HS1-25]|uniref:N-acetyltransferase n=1 Tax=Lutibacter sp. HS1-25 TaxID=2485000 RepID=UPI001013386A|nr:N-acetyltransferase [Lutibacter sp. HS1-25]RXP45410.1 N-acetyltransferase [Lutibacter sp. HS1-25]
MKFNNRNVFIDASVVLGQNVQIGDNTTIYSNVIIGDNTIIADNCVIGEPNNSYYRNQLEYINPKTVIKSNSLIRSYTIIYAGSKFGENLNTGHHVTIRENTTAGKNCSFGSYNDIQGECEIGDYCRLQSYVNIGQRSKIGSFVFIYPYVVLTNDATPPSNLLQGVVIDDYSQITAGCVLLPGTNIGKYCLTSANSTVGGVFEDDSFIAGTPAKKIGKLSKMPFFNEENKRHYPWPKYFERGMPWEGIGFEQWNKLNEND